MNPLGAGLFWRAIVAIPLWLALCAANAYSGVIPGSALARIKSIGIIAALGDTCMFERVADTRFEWIAPPEATFLEISDWNLDDRVIDTITQQLAPHRLLQTVTIEHQDFDNWTYDTLTRRIRELPVPETPVDAYLAVLRDWSRDPIGRSDHEVAGLGLYRRDAAGGSERIGVFADYRLVLIDAETGALIASRAARLPSGSLPWVSGRPSLWPATQNDLTEAQRQDLQADFLKLIGESLPHTLQQMGFGG
jgi:hypothetical protein